MNLRVPAFLGLKVLALAQLFILTIEPTSYLEFSKKPSSYFRAKDPKVEFLTNKLIYYIERPKKHKEILIIQSSDEQKIYLKVNDSHKYSIIEVKEKAFTFAYVTSEELIYM